MDFTIVIFFIAALFIQTVTNQCIPHLKRPIASRGYSNFKPMTVASLSNGGGLVVTSSSPVAPTGLSLLAKNLVIEGLLNVEGELPLLATVSVEGDVPAGGQVETTYSCGNENVEILSETGNFGGTNNGIEPVEGPHTGVD